MAIDASAVARVVGIETQFRDLREGGVLFLPQRIAVIAQGASASVYSTDKFQATSALEVGQKLGFGSPAHLIARMLWPTNGDGVGTIPVTFYPLVDDASGVAAAGDITPSGSATATAVYRVVVNNIRSAQFSVTADDTVATLCTKITAAINAVLEMPVVATDSTTKVDLAAKWEGAGGNDIHVEVVGEDVGVTFTVTQPIGGDGDPDIDDALAQFGTVWESLVIDGVSSADSVAALRDFGEGRWLPTVRKPFVAFRATTDDLATSVAVVGVVGTKTDRVNVLLTAPGSKDLPFAVAARQVARIATRANNNPARGYAGQRATLLTPGPTEEQWTFEQRDVAVKAGVSTTEVVNDEIQLADIVTFYRPDGDPNPAYRYVRNIIKLQNILFNLALIFEAEDWKDAPLIPDDQPTVNPAARKPRSAVGQVVAMHRSLALNALISDFKFAQENTSANISSQNPNRLDVNTTVKLSGNTDQIAVGLNFGFFFGEASLAA
jgi:phage tail sheath gpL-like